MCQCRRPLLCTTTNSFVPEQYALPNTQMHVRRRARIRMPEITPHPNYMVFFFSVFGSLSGQQVLLTSNICAVQFLALLNAVSCYTHLWGCLLTTSKFKGTGMGIHWEILQLHGALRWYSQPGSKQKIRAQNITIIFFMTRPLIRNYLFSFRSSCTLLLTN